jgi:hypothetical protein
MNHRQRKETGQRNLISATPFAIGVHLPNQADQYSRFFVIPGIGTGYLPFGSLASGAGAS